MAEYAKLALKQLEKRGKFTSNTGNPFNLAFLDCSTDFLDTIVLVFSFLSYLLLLCRTYNGITSVRK